MGVAAAGCGHGASRNSRILFQTDRDGDWALYAMDPDGGRSRRVLKAGGGPYPSSYGQPIVSPDEHKVLLPERGVVVVTLADGARRRLGGGDESSASWAPDSERVVFSGRENRGLVVSDLRGHNRRLLRGELTWTPAWSPDGDWIAYVTESRVSGAVLVYAIHPDGSGRKQVSDYAPAGTDRLAWSKDGRLAFVGGVWDSSELGLVIVDVAAGSSHQLAEAVDGGTPSWSPDGKRFAYVTEVGRSHRAVLFTIGSAGRRKLRVVRAAPGEYFDSPVWSPDGKRLLFVRTRWAGKDLDGELPQIWTVRRDGSDQRALTRGYPAGGSNLYPAWVRGTLRNESPPRPTARRRGRRFVLRMPFPVGAVSVDGRSVAIAPAPHDRERLDAPQPPVYVWRPATRDLIPLVASACGAVDQLTLARGRVAFNCDQSGVDVVAQSLRVQDLTTRLPRKVFYGHNGGAALSPGLYLDKLSGGGQTLVFDSEQTDPQGRPLGRRIWRIGATRASLLRSGGALLAADDGTIVVELPGGRVATLNADGTVRLRLKAPLLPPPRPFFGPPPPRRAALGGGKLVLALGQRLAVYDASDGLLLHAWPYARASRGFEGAWNGVALYVHGRTLSLVGKAKTSTKVPVHDRWLRRLGYWLDQSVHAAVGQSGLVFSYNVDDRRFPGRVVFVPMAIGNSSD
jgi:Tol biopolymer transport system component